MFDANYLISRLSRAMETTPGKVFATRPGLPGVTYAQLFAGAQSLAQKLMLTGLQPGDRVAVQVEKTLEAVELYLGTVLAGGIFLPLNTAYTGAEMDYFITDAAPRILVCDPGRIDELAPLAGGATVFTLDKNGKGTLMTDLPDPDPAFKPVPRGADDLAAILYTSGTTGRSKGAMLSHKNLASNSESLRDLWRFTDQDVLIHALPIFHTHGLFVATNVALLAGASVVFLPKFDAEAILDAMPTSTALMGVPTFYTRLLDNPHLTLEQSRNMRLFVSGSAPLLVDTHEKWQTRTGHRILERYGMTETNMSTSNPYDGERRAGTVGLPLPGVELRIMGTHGEVAQGEIGVIEVRGDNVFQGYWQMPEKTAEELRPDGWFITGDLATRDADGYVSIVGRAKDLIITGGFNVYPKELESLIDDIPGVLESAVIGVPHRDFGEAVVAVVVKQTPDLTLEQIKTVTSRDLAKFKQPKQTLFLPELPRNTMGKVQKKALRETFEDLFSQESPT
ncbi:Long-chain-fatty-acid--CoA ligase [Thalassovita gelatinovora]|uniref:Long-chain-fatty-acid--CoA ligase n=1 Tax=Thalassovita gelatinovora TaxID=53501 RepID=A0A0P1FRF7_THAGE|nr:malonyl-CoA synthase [Thalassovita gelatinovora]QIZ80982.1 malonyl-CoA synthase [Thalassovita gelatinovora]CUH63519.1 Long-chain-fatty-acid--CoA ligase [Thalassovita gelatinovora]SEQ68598.1 malonyl-CoA/methylmalonyl-CoA synthetase [Thalassovita gelatinovora]